MNKCIKNLICIVLCAFIVASLSTVSFAANVDVDLDFVSMMYALLKTGDIVVESSVAPIQAILDLINYGSGTPWSPIYFYEGPSWDDEILNRSIITIDQDVITIDGVTYSDIWLSHDAAEKFRVNLLDIETAWNLASNSSGVFGEGYGMAGDIPLFSIDGLVRSQNFAGNIPDFSTSSSYVVGPVVFTVKTGSGTVAAQVSYDAYYNNTRKHNTAGSYRPDTPPHTFNSWLVLANPEATTKTLQFHFVNNANSIDTYVSWIPQNDIVHEPFDFDWAAGTLPAQQLPDDFGMRIRVPSTVTDPTTGQPVYDIDDIVNTYPQLPGTQIELDPDINPDADIDADFLEDLLRIIKLLLDLDLWDLLDVTFDEPEPQPSPEPSPPPSPEPSTPISDVPADWLDQILRWIQETIKQIKTAIETAVETLVETLTEVKTKVQEILDHIKQGHIDLFKTTLDVIKSFFAPIFALLRSALGLWHYVVEWVQATAPVFSTFFGFMSGTNYNMVLPVYAALAGPICIAIYKRFGR